MANGIFRVVKLLLDRAAAKRMQDEAQEALRKGTDPTKPKQNLSAVESALESIRSAALKLGGVLAGVFAIHKLVEFGKSSVEQAMNAEVGWTQLSNALKNVGVNVARELPKLKQLGEQFQKSTRFDDDAFVKALTRGIQITGNYERAMRLMTLASDVAVTKHVELADAMEQVARISQGQTRGLKEFGITTDDANKGLELLQKRLQGATQEDLTTFSGKLEQVKNQWDDLKKAFGFTLIGGDSIANLEKTRLGIEKLTPQAEHLAELFRWTFEGLAKVPGAIETAEQWALDHLPGGAARAARRNLAQADAAAEQRKQDLLALMFPTKAKTTTTGGFDALESEAQKTRREAAAKKTQEETLQRAQVAFEKEQARKKAELDVLSGTNKTLRGFRRDQVNAPGQTLDSTSKIMAMQAEAIRGQLAGIEEAAQGAAAGITGAFQDTFAILLTGFDNVGDAAKTLGKGIAGALLGGVAQYASGKVKENVALSFEEIAKGIAASANPFMSWTAPIHFKAAASHAGVAALWGALAGASGAGQGAVAGGGRGGLSGGVPSGATDVGGRIASGTVTRGTEVHIYIDPLNPQDPAYQRNVHAAGQYARERYGDNAKIIVHPRTGT